MDQEGIDGRIGRIDLSEEEALIWRAVKAGYGTLKEVEKWSYEDLLKMVYFDDIEAIESHCMTKQQEKKEEIIEEMADG